MTKLKNSNCDQTQKPKLWQIVIKIKNSNCDKTKKKSNFDKTKKNLNCDKTQSEKHKKLKLGPNSETEIVTNLKNSKCDKTQKLKWWPYQNCKKKKVKNSHCDKTFFSFTTFLSHEIVFLKKSKNQIVTTLKNSNCVKTQKLKLRQNSKTQVVTKVKNQILTKIKNSNCDKTFFSFTTFLSHFFATQFLWHFSV